MADNTNLTAGDNAEDVIAGKGNQQQRNQQRSDPQQNTYIGAGGTGDNMQLWLKFYELAQLIREHSNRINMNETQITLTQARVSKLEGMEVEVRKDAVVIRSTPTPPPDALNIPMRTLVWVLLCIIFIVVLIVGFLVYKTLRG